MLFLPKHKPNLRCLILGHVYKFDYWGYPADCPICGQELYTNNHGYGCMDLYHRAIGLYWRARHLYYDVKAKFIDDEIPF